MSRVLPLWAICIIFTAALPGCGGGGNPAGGGTTPASSFTSPALKDKNGKRVIAVIPKGNQHEFWRAVETGARSAAEGKNVEIIFKAGEPNDDANAQLTMVDRMLAQGVDAIVLAPVHAKFLVQAVEKCNEKNVPIVIIDSAVDIDFNKYVSFVATDNKDGGAQCAKRLGKEMNGKGDVLLFRFSPGSASTGEREEGFTETLKKEFPGIKIVAEKFAGATPEESLRNANELLGANPKFDGVFASNESSTRGMLAALRERKLNGKVKFVGFDTAKELVEAVEAGDIDALAAQSPFHIGADGVREAILALDKQKTDPIIVIAAVMKDKAYLKAHPDDEKEAAGKIDDEIRKQEADVKLKLDELKLKEEQMRKVLEERQKEEEAKKPK